LESCSTFSIPICSNSLILSCVPIKRFHLIGTRSGVQMTGKEYQGEFEPECLGPCGARLHVGTLKGVGLVCRRIFIDTYAKAGFAKLHDCKTPIMAADLELAGSCPSTRRAAPYRPVFSPIAAPNNAAPHSATL
jgi:hypothetical protein